MNKKYIILVLLLLALTTTLAAMAPSCMMGPMPEMCSDAGGTCTDGSECPAGQHDYPAGDYCTTNPNNSVCCVPD